MQAWLFNHPVHLVAVVVFIASACVGGALALAFGKRGDKVAAMVSGMADAVLSVRPSRRAVDARDAGMASAQTVRPGGDDALPVAPSGPPAGPCDWGYCDRDATTWRYAPGHGWLPVCADDDGPPAHPDDCLCEACDPDTDNPLMASAWFRGLRELEDGSARTGNSPDDYAGGLTPVTVSERWELRPGPDTAEWTLSGMATFADVQEFMSGQDADCARFRMELEDRAAEMRADMAAA